MCSSSRWRVRLVSKLLNYRKTLCLVPSGTATYNRLPSRARRSCAEFKRPAPVAHNPYGWESTWRSEDPLGAAAGGRRLEARSARAGVAAPPGFPVAAVGPRRGRRVPGADIALVAVALWLASGFFQVKAAERGV